MEKEFQKLQFQDLGLSAPHSDMEWNDENHLQVNTWEAHIYERLQTSRLSRAWEVVNSNFYFNNSNPIMGLTLTFRFEMSLPSLPENSRKTVGKQMRTSENI